MYKTMSRPRVDQCGNAERGVRYKREESGMRKELGSEREDVLSQNTSECAQEEPTQSSVCAEA